MKCREPQKFPFKVQISVQLYSINGTVSVCVGTDWGQRVVQTSVNVPMFC